MIFGNSINYSVLNPALFNADSNQMHSETPDHFFGGLTCLPAVAIISASMKILLAIRSGNPYGAERIVCSLARGLHHLGEDVMTLCPAGSWLDSQLRQDGVRTTESRSEAADFHPDIINSHSRSLTDLKFQGVLHVATVNRMRFSIQHRHADRWITLFEGCRQSRWRALAFGNRIANIPPGIPAPSVVAVQKSTKHRLVCLGRITASKGQVIAIHALEMLARVGLSDFELRLVGSIDAPYEAEFRARLERSTIRDRITLAGEILESGEALAGADLLLHPSSSDGTPLAIAEAMMLGIPVLATRVGGIPEMIIDGDTGYLVPLRPESFSEFIGRALLDDEARGIMGHRARAFALDHFNEERMVRETQVQLQRWLS